MCFEAVLSYWSTVTLVTIIFAFLPAVKFPGFKYRIHMWFNFLICFMCIVTFTTVTIKTFMYCFYMCFDVSLFFLLYVTFFTIKFLPSSFSDSSLQIALAGLLPWPGVIVTHHRGQHLVAGQACGTCNPDQGWCDPSQGAAISGLPGLRSVTLPQGAVTLSKGWCLPITGGQD